MLFIVDICLRNMLDIPQLGFADAMSGRMGSAAVFLEFIHHDELHEPYGMCSIL